MYSATMRFSNEVGLHAEWADGTTAIGSNTVAVVLRSSIEGERRHWELTRKGAFEEQRGSKMALTRKTWACYPGIP